MSRFVEQTNSASRQITRRRFLGTAAAASGVLAAPWIVPASVLGADGAVAPSERITIGLIGRGLMGRGHLHRLVGDAGVPMTCNYARASMNDAAWIDFGDSPLKPK